MGQAETYFAKYVSNHLSPSFADIGSTASIWRAIRYGALALTAPGTRIPRRASEVR